MNIPMENKGAMSKNTFYTYIVFAILFTIALFAIYFYNYAGITTTLGYSILLTLFISITLMIIFRNVHFFKKLDENGGANSHYYQNIYSFVSFLFTGGLVTFLFYLLGAFQTSLPTNNANTVLNYDILLSFIIIGGICFLPNSGFTIPSTEITKELLQTINAEKKYSILFILFLILSITLFVFNPFGILTSFSGSILFYLLFFCILFVTMISYYHYLTYNPSKISNSGNPSAGTILLNTFSVLLGLGVSSTVIYFLITTLGIFSQTSISSETVKTIINILILVVMLAILYKILNRGDALQQNTWVRKIINLLLYIPHLLVNIIDFILKEYKQTKQTELILLFMELLLILFYVIYPYFLSYLYKQGGNQLVNDPISLATPTTLSTYENLNNGDHLNYQYAISCWVYIDALPGSTNSSYTTSSTLLTYGDNPCIKYDAPTNSIIITVKQENETPISVVNVTHELENTISSYKQPNFKDIQDKIHQSIDKVNTIPVIYEVDEQGHRIIYKHSGVLLQKWNHILINYHGGTLDIFYNGKLVKSSIEVVPYLSYDSLNVGNNNGISGQICNVTYFKKPLDILTINNLYYSMKNKNPPIL